ncbi:MAG TPA: DUF370 domain-containing protein [Firmicutes bacterium]|jgi:regulator of extracellular matrix RemA (YlzA/DUF370 family)|nr:DUF370 domain-containing protein [Bacillota bacterium]HBK67899.1 DUF370 domain-containing protein [Bacillota bacterium]HBT15620.1 DUF370 domain-containing protein [Bacillota bacterium]
MFLHLGGVTVISIKEIIAVLNLEKINFREEWVNQSLPKKQLLDISEGKPKSAIFTDEKVILSPISSFTLKKRLKQIPA